MELRQLEYFRAIVDEEALASSKALHMTQPPLQLSDENARGRTAGFAFSSRHQEITLTEAGKDTLRQAETLLMLANLTKQEVIKSGRRRLCILE